MTSITERVPLTQEDCLLAASKAERWPPGWDFCGGGWESAKGVRHPAFAIIDLRQATGKDAELIEWSVKRHYLEKTGNILNIDLFYRPMQVAAAFRHMAAERTQQETEK